MRLELGFAVVLIAYLLGVITGYVSTVLIVERSGRKRRRWFDD